MSSVRSLRLLTSPAKASLGERPQKNNGPLALVEMGLAKS